MLFTSLLLLIIVRNEIDDAEVVSFSNQDVNCVIVSRKHEASLAFKDEVNVVHMLAFHVNVLVFLELHRYEHRTDPSDKWNRLLLEKLNILVDFLMNLLGQFKLQMVRQFRLEIAYIEFLLLVFIIDESPDLIKKLETDIVLFLDLVQSRHLFFYLGLLSVLL